MADMDYNREISPWGVRRKMQEKTRERERDRKKSEGGKQTQATQDLEINVVPLALGIRNDRLLCEWPLLWGCSLDLSGT